MRVLRSLKVFDGAVEREIQLCEGDLTNVDAKFFATDILALSAFDGDYTETPSSLIGKLAATGVSIRKMAQDPDTRLNSRHCWFSKPIVSAPPGFPFTRVVCVETPRGGSPLVAASDMFTALSPFLMRNPTMSSVSLPILGTGDQGASLAEMLKALIKEAHICLAGGGLGLRLFRIVAFGEDSSQQAISAFDELVRSDAELQESSNRVPEFDVFVSYARSDLNRVTPIFERLKSTSLKVFIDTHTLKTGDVWLDGIYKAIAKSKVFLALISDNFNRSKYCQQESDHANRLYGTGNPALFPVRIEKVAPEDPFHRREAKLLDQLGIDGLCVEVGRACQPI